MIKNSPLTPCMVMSLLAVACGGSADSGSEAEAAAAAAAPASAPELGGRYELAGAEPFTVTVDDANLTCQSGPVSPFRAQWDAPDMSTHVLVTGYPQEGTDEHRVDAYRVEFRDSGANRTQAARLADVTLTAREVSRTGASAVYDVEAAGTFVDGGSFTASGTCRA
jgi:hypothetical protein